MLVIDTEMKKTRRGLGCSWVNQDLSFGQVKFERTLDNQVKMSMPVSKKCRKSFCLLIACFLFFSFLKADTFLSLYFYFNEVWKGNIK